MCLKKVTSFILVVKYGYSFYGIFFFNVRFRVKSAILLLILDICVLSNPAHFFGAGQVICAAFYFSVNFC